MKGRRPRPSRRRGPEPNLSGGTRNVVNVGSHASLGHRGPNPQTSFVSNPSILNLRAPIAQLVELRTFNRCTWAFAASASVGAFGVNLLLAAWIRLVALAGAGRVWERCGIDCGICWSAYSICSQRHHCHGFTTALLRATVSTESRSGCAARRVSCSSQRPCWAKGRIRTPNHLLARRLAAASTATCRDGIEAATVHHRATPSLADAGLRGGSVAVNARHGADREAAWR